MGKTLILGIDELAQGQSQAFTTVNDAIQALEDASNRRKVVDASVGGTVNLTELELVQYGWFRVSGHTTAVTLTFPRTINTNNVNRVVCVENVGTAEITMQANTSPASSVRIPAGGARIVGIYYDECLALSEGQKVSGVPFSIGVFAGGTLVNNTEIVRYPMVENIEFPDNFAGALGSISVNPNKPISVSVLKNGTAIGSINIATSGTFTFTTTGATVETFAVGDVLTLVALKPEESVVTFASVADSGDTITIGDGLNTATVFTFGGGGVATGATANDSAANLAAAINAITTSLLVDAVAVGAVVTLTNRNVSGGGTVAKSDADNDYSFTAFTADTTAMNLGINFKGLRV